MKEEQINYLLMNGFKILELTDEKRFYIFSSIEYPQKTNITHCSYLQIVGFEITEMVNKNTDLRDLIDRFLDKKKNRIRISENTKFIEYQAT